MDDGLAVAVAVDGDVESAERGPLSSTTIKTTSKPIAKVPAPTREQINTTCDSDVAPWTLPGDNELPISGAANGLRPAGRAPSGEGFAAKGEGFVVAAAAAMANGC